MATTLVAGGWTIEVDGDHVRLRYNNQKGLIEVRAEVDRFAGDMVDSTLGEPIASCFALYEDLESISE